MKKRLVVGVSGASGAVLAVRLLEELRKHDEYETHLVISASGAYTLEQEVGMTASELAALAGAAYSPEDLWAPISSGTFETQGMVVVPCSMKTVAGISNGFSDNLLLRSADVTLKEGRKLVLAARESPLSRIHLRNLLTASEAGALIIPPMMTFYNSPESIGDMTHHIVCRLLAPFGIECEGFRRWR